MLNRMPTAPRGCQCGIRQAAHSLPGSLATQCRCRQSPGTGTRRPGRAPRHFRKLELPDSIQLSERHNMRKHLNLWLTLVGVGGFMIYAITVMIMAPV